MGKLSNNQSGFSPVEALLILVIIGIIGFVGWYVFNAQKNTDKDLSVTNTTAVAPKKKTTAKTSTSPTATNGLAIKEWGITIPQPTDGGPYSYSVEDSSDIWLTSPQLTTALADAAKAAGDTCGTVLGIQVFRTTPSNVTSDGSRKYTSAIAGNVYGLAQGDLSEALAPCGSNKELSDAVTLAETQLASVWDKVTAQSN